MIALRAVCVSTCLIVLAVNSASGVSRVVVTRISPGFAIVTEIDNAAPYVGQQFSIVYWLRAVRPPSAVDIDPQQFTGFWVEIPGLPADLRSAAQKLDGKRASEYLLRQVIAFPLSDGKLQLPPLRLKIKMEGSAAGTSVDWDLVCLSDPVTLSISAIPMGHERAEGFPLVGTLEGTLVPVRGASNPEIVLEMQGTANLAFFEPLRWIRNQEELELSARLTDWEDMVQTREMAGKRQLVLLQRRRWNIRSLGLQREESRIDDLSIRVFHPETGTWAEKKIPGFKLKSSGLNALPARANVSIHPPTGLRRYFVWVAGAAAGLLMICLSWVWIRIRRPHRQDRVSKGLATLEKTSATSPKSFLDTAHKLLERYAAENQLSGSIGQGNTTLDGCWNSVERLRFGFEPPSTHVRDEILDFLKDLLVPKAGVNPSDGRRNGAMAQRDIEKVDD